MLINDDYPLWINTSVREYLNNEFYNELPDDLKQYISNTEAVTLEDNNINYYKKTIDKIYIGGLREYANLDDSDSSTAAIYEGILTDYKTTRELDYYHDLKIKNILSDNLKKTYEGNDDFTY